MKRILKYVFKYKVLIIVPAIAMLFSIILDMFNPYLTKIMIDKVIVNKELSILKYVLIGLVVITVSRSILGYVKEYIFDVVSAKIALDIKNDLFNHIQSLSFSYFDNINTGELMSRIGEDVDNVWRTVSFGLRLFVENSIYFVMATSILFFLSVKLTLICLIAMPPIAYFALKLEKKMGESYEKLSDQGVLLNTAAQENIAGVRLVKAFAREKHEILKFLELNKQNYELNVEQSNIMAKYFPPMEFLTNISIVLMVSLGGIFVMKGNISIGTLVAFNGYIWMLIWPMRMLGWLTNMLAQNNASAKKIYKIFDLEPSIKDSPTAVSLADIDGHVKFQGVSFKYNDDLVLKDINMDVKPGSTVAIMGTTGSGKSSIVNLIGRYYDVNSGSISIDEVDVRGLQLKDIRSKMAVVSQDTFLFSESIAVNVGFGNTLASLDEIKAACKDACAHDFIEQLDKGYDTVIGERGIGLSGGEKQRISIARALLRDSSILILDDASSALDMDTEYTLLKNLHNRKNKPTTFIIAHRISAVKNADEIIFIDNGSIVERGTHSSLLSEKGKYYEVYSEQFKDFEDIEGEVV
jgi:ATP-binding cassette subfamily B multidrug efflux pump